MTSTRGLCCICDANAALRGAKQVLDESEAAPGPALKGLEGASARFRKVFEDGPLGIVVVAPDFTFADVNPAFCNLLGYRLDELVGRPFVDVIHPDDVEDEAEFHLRAFQAEGLPYRADKRLVTKSGAAVWASLLVTVVDDNGGVPFYGLAMAVDIQDRKHTEEALRKSLETSRALLNVPIGSAILMELDGTIVALNTTAIERLPGDAGELLGRSIYDLMPPETARSRKAAVRWVVASGEPERIEERTDDGWFITRIYPVFDEGGSVGRVALYIRDITRLRHAEAALEESQSTVGALLSGTPDMVFRMKADGTFVDFLPATEIDPIVPPAQFIGRTAREVLPKDIAEQMQAKIEEAVRTNALQQHEYQLPGEDGIETFESRIVPIENDEVLAIVRDITERRRAQDGLAASEARWRSVGQQAPGTITTFDCEGRISFVSRDLWGVTADSVIGTTIFDHLGPNDGEEMKSRLAPVFASGESESCEVTFRSSNGHYTCWDNRIGPIVNGGGVEAAIMISTNVTTRYRMHEELSRLREELETKIEQSVSTDAAYGLSFRELTVLHLAAEGRSDKEIASVLGISHRTVQAHITHILQKMNASNRAEASARAQREGLIV